LADYSIRQPVGVLEDVLVQMGKFVIPCDFIVMDMDENLQMPIIVVSCYCRGADRHAGCNYIFSAMWGEGGFLFFFPHTNSTTCYPLTSCYP